ncbi:diguanylate cyclase [Shewanella frigidimarina]|uniref:GGDEF domain-containing protein n=1 Tax=Shewanella frigidimarina TaxID=56812 RepID=UPI003D78F7B5
MVKTKLMILLVCAMSWPLTSWGAGDVFSDANANDTKMNGANVSDSTVSDNIVSNNTVSNNTDSATITDIEQQLATLDLPQQRIDFLQQQLQQSVQWPIEQQGQLLHLLATEQEVNSDLVAAIDSYTQAINLLTPHPLSQELVKSYLERSFILYLQTNDTQVYCPDREVAITLARQLGNVDILAEVLAQSAYCYNKPSDFGEGLKRLNEALALAQQHQLGLSRQAMIFNATAAIYRDNGLNRKAYEYFNKAYDFWEQAQDKQDMFNMLHNMVGESIKLAMWVENKAHLAQMQQLVEQSPEFADFDFFYQFNTGISCWAQGLFQEGIDHFLRALEVQDTTQEKYFVDATNAWLALSYFRQQQPDKAFKYAEIFSSSATYDGHSNELKLMIAAIIDYANGSNNLGMNKLLDTIDLQKKNFANIINNDVVNSSLDHNLTVAEFNNRLLEKQLAINKLNLEAEIDSQKITNLSMAIAVLIALVLLVVVIFLWQSRRQFKRRSQTDYLTGIANRRHTFEQGKKRFYQAKKHNRSLAVIMFDIDNFKAINDHYGHDVGDLAIKACGRRARNWLKKNDVLGRIGGEEFLIILPDTEQAQAVEIAERLRTSIESNQFVFNEVKMNFTISVAVAMLTPQTHELVDIIKQADLGLYQAKDNGRNQVVVVDH